MYNLADLILDQPLVPFIRESNYAVRGPASLLNRRLLDYLLIYIQEGDFLINADGTEYRFNNGDFCLIQPDTVLSLRGITNTITPFAHFDIFYNPERENSFPTRMGQLDLSEYRHLMQPKLNDIQGVQVPVKLKITNPIQFRDTILKMVECWQHHDPFHQLESQHLATELILTILKDHNSLNMKTTPTLSSLNWITSYFSFRLSEPLSVEDMAKRANLSPCRFSVVFKNKFGIPPHQYLLQLRVKHAQELLQCSDLKLKDIATYCGFSDVQHFSKSFKKIVGQPPGSYRHC